MSILPGDSTRLHNGYIRYICNNIKYFFYDVKNQFTIVKNYFKFYVINIITFLDATFKIKSCEKRICLNALPLYKLQAINYDTHIRPSHTMNRERLK